MHLSGSKKARASTFVPTNGSKLGTVQTIQYRLGSRICPSYCSIEEQIHRQKSRIHNTCAFLGICP